MTRLEIQSLGDTELIEARVRLVDNSVSSVQAMIDSATYRMVMDEIAARAAELNASAHEPVTA